MTLNAFIFDLDGTLVDTELVWADALSAYLGANGYACPRHTVLEIVFGRSWTDIYSDITQRFPSLATKSAAVMAHELREYYLRLRQTNDNVIIHSSVRLLKELSLRYPVIIVSGSPRADVEEAVELIGAVGAVRFILGAEDYAPGKPSPAGFLMGAQTLGIPPENCVVFEDSRAGVSAAKAAGMWCVALARDAAHPQDLSAADWVLSDLSQFSVDAFMRQLAVPKK